MGNPTRDLTQIAVSVLFMKAKDITNLVCFGSILVHLCAQVYVPFQFAKNKIAACHNDAKMRWVLWGFGLCPVYRPQSLDHTDMPLIKGFGLACQIVNFLWIKNRRNYRISRISSRQISETWSDIAGGITYMALGRAAF